MIPTTEPAMAHQVRVEGLSPMVTLATTAEAIGASCRYGQALGEARDHYEETNSAGWDLEADILDAVARLTGDDDPEAVNPDVPGWWSGLTP